MRLPVQKLRWFLIAGASLLLLVLVAYVGYGRYKALKRWKTFLQHSGATITHDTNGFTYSQSLKGKTVFTLHAAKASQHPDGKWSLHDAELTLYSKTSTRADHIYGSEFEYDPQEGVARALGEVHMDLEAPQAFAGGGKPNAAPQRIRGKEGRAPSARRSADESLQTIHVRTSGLVYVRSLGVAATKEDVQFNFGDIECHAHGAEFEQGESTVHLLADVHMSGDLHGKPMNLTAFKADLDRANNLATLASPVLRTPERTVSAANAVLHLRMDGSVEAAEAHGAVTLVSGTQTVRTDRLDATLTPQSQPKTAKLSGGVVLDDTSAQRPMHGKSQQVDVAFDAAGQAQTVLANGQALLAISERAPGKPALARMVAGDHILMTLTHDEGQHTSRLNEVHITGHADAQGESLAMKSGAATKSSTHIAADDLRATFVADVAHKAQAQRMIGTGHTHLLQSNSLGDQQSSSADTLEINFAPASNGTPGELQVADATETGHVTMKTFNAAKGNATPVESTGSSDRAVYQGASQQLTLTGHAQLAQNGTQVMANSVVLDQATGNAQAQGGVMATLANASAASEENNHSHVMSDSAKFSHSSQLAEFTGTDAHPARLWQEASQVQAASLLMDGKAKTLIARPASPTGSVNAVFAANSAKPQADNKAGAHIVRVASARMDYSDMTHEAVFGGGVKMNAATGDVRSQRAVVFLTPKAPKPAVAAPGTTIATADPLASSLDRAVASGSVHLEQPGRSGTGEQLLYTAATDSFVLTGTPAAPPRISDAQQGTITGATLLFGAADSTIVVAGNPADGKRSRVRTETDVKQ